MLDNIRNIIKNSDNRITDNELNNFYIRFSEVLQDEGIIHSFIYRLTDFLKQESRNLSGSKDNQVSQILETIKKLLLTSFGPSNTEEIKDENFLQVFFIIGLQGVGKTSVCSKLAQKISLIHGAQDIIVMSVDNQRPAGQVQLKKALDRIEVECVFGKAGFEYESFDIVYNNALKNKKKFLIIDTAGLNFINIKQINQINKMQYNSIHKQTFFVLDSMIGKSALQSLKRGTSLVSADCLIITKMDDNNTTGSLINSRIATELPIKYITSGESVTSIQAFNRKHYYNHILSKLRINEIFSNN